MNKHGIKVGQTLWYVPPHGSFIDRRKVRPTKVRGTDVWGWTYRRAGFSECGETKGGLLALQLLPANMPEPSAALPMSMAGTPLFQGVSA